MIALSVLALLTSAGPCSAGGEFEPQLCPTGLPRVVSVHIVAQGITRWKDPDPAPDCPHFRMTEAEAKYFFRHARSADPREVHYALPESACVVRGSVTFADGSHGSWQVDSFALGWLDRPRRPRLTLYCRRCQSAPWMPSR